MSDVWGTAEYRYSAEQDAIELVGAAGDVVGIIPRNAIIRMLGMLPGNPRQQIILVGDRHYGDVPARRKAALMRAAGGISVTETVDARKSGMAGRNAQPHRKVSAGKHQQAQRKTKGRS
jgi:hypothetical protein